MDSRERLLLTLEGGEPDRIPRALGFYRVDMESLAPDGRFDNRLVDIRFVSFPESPEEAQLRRTARPYEADTRLGNPAQIANYQRWQYRPGDAQRNPLERARSLDDLRSFPFPEARAPYVVSGLRRQVAALRSHGLAVGGSLPHLGGELFESAWRLRGLENFLFDLIERPDWAHFLLDRLTELAQRNAESLARVGVDVLALDDDVGMPGTMMISPDHWREFFKPRLESIIVAARNIQSTVRVLYHSDGYFEPIIGDLIEIGVDAINPVQPDHMDAARIRATYGDRVVLWGTVGSQTTFSLSSPEEIRSEVRTRITALGRTGLILAPAYDIDEPDIPWVNIATFLQAAEDYG